jgi:hypothetical protein
LDGGQALQLLERRCALRREPCAFASGSLDHALGLTRPPGRVSRVNAAATRASITASSLSSL